MPGRLNFDIAIEMRLTYYVSYLINTSILLKVKSCGIPSKLFRYSTISGTLRYSLKLKFLEIK